MSASTPYFMEDPREATRLESKVDASDWAHRYIASPDPASRRLLDVGCGPAALLSAAARLRPQDIVTGVDASKERLRFAADRVALLRNADVLHACAMRLPFGDNHFDLVWTRFLLEYLPEPAGAIAEMVRVCRPGGEVLLQDLDGQLAWHDPLDERLGSRIERTLASLARTGFDPYIGRKLFRLARHAGLVDVRVDVEPYHLIAGQASANELALWRAKLEIARPSIQAALGDEEGGAAIASFVAHLEDPDTLTYCVQFTVRGRKPITDRDVIC